jgi:thiamine kinase-like enzyme
MKSKSLLIIGGTGFFGQSIIKYLSTKNFLNLQINKIFILSRGKLKITIYNKKLRKKFKVIKLNSNILTVKKLPKVDYVIYAAILKNYQNDNKGTISIIHGDTVMTNILIDNEKKIKLIDMRGRLGNILTKCQI